MKLSALVEQLGKWAPLEAAEEWDNVGLLCGDREREVQRVLCCVDYTDAVSNEPADVVVAYHPPIFQGLKRIPFHSPIGRAVANGVAVYSPHTALDAAPGGTNDVLADACGLGDRQPLRPIRTDQLKLVTFVPEEALERVSAAVFAAGAGVIGKYSQCSFRSAGTGTFFGEEGTSPAVGEAGRLEKAAEVRIETILPAERVDAVMRALKTAHPYETPAFDLLKLHTLPQATGQGRVGDLASPVPLRMIIDHVKKHMGVTHVLLAGVADDRVKRIAVAAGAGSELMADALSAKADVFVTGEVRHHDALRALSRGMRVVMLMHSNSERRAIAKLAERIGKLGVPCTMSTQDRDPFTII